MSPMRPSNPFEVCTTELEPYVYKLGGKFGPLEALREKREFQDRVLPVEYVMPGEDFQGDSAFERPYVRASHPIDIRDMVGVLETLPALSSSNADVRAIVAQIRRQASTREVISFANYSAEDTMYNPDHVVLGVQPFVQGMRASVLAHPNRPDDDPEYVISWFQHSKEKSNDALASGLEIQSATFDARGQIRHMLADTLKNTVQPNMSPEKLIELYRQVEATRLMRPDRTFLMETVGDENDLSLPAYVCQLRDFKERQVADWRIDPSRSRYDLPRLVFGVTPEEGERLTVVHSPDCLDANGKPIQSRENPWALLRTQHQSDPPLMFQPDNMKAYLAGFRFGSGMPSLAHLQERLAAIADVAVFEDMQKPSHYDVPSLRPVDAYNPKRDFDFSRRLVAEMAADEQFTEFQLRHGGKLEGVRDISNLARRDTSHQGNMLDLLHSTRGKAFDIILRSDGYTADIQVADGQKVTALPRRALVKA